MTIMTKTHHIIYLILAGVISNWKINSSFVTKKPPSTYMFDLGCSLATSEKKI